MHNEIQKRLKSIEELEFELTIKSAKYGQMLVNLKERYGRYLQESRLQDAELQRLGEIIRTYERMSRR